MADKARKRHVSLCPALLVGRLLEGKVAIVTGASAGIGKSIAMVLADAGAKVAMAARREDKLKEVENEIVSKGGVAISVKTDVSNREQVLELVRQTEQTLGQVDILVNNAATFYFTLLKNLHWKEWDSMIEVNVKGTTNCIGAVVTEMVNRKRGHIVFISSDAGKRGFPGAAVYCGTKFYQEGLIQALRHEVCGSGVKVTSIQPGYVETDIHLYSTDTEAQALYDMSEKIECMKPEDIANAVLYAVSQPANVAVNEMLIQPKALPL